MNAHPWATFSAAGSRGVPIVGLEPSCLLTLRDELLSLRSDDTAKAVSAQALLFEEFLVREAEAGRLRLPLGPVGAKAVVHGVYTDYKTNVALDDAVFTKKN